MKQRLHPIELTLMIVAALALTSGAVALHTQSQLAEKVVRLHVLANSDSEEDQALKLKGRTPCWNRPRRPSGERTVRQRPAAA